MATQLTQDSESSNHLCHRKVPNLIYFFYTKARCHIFGFDLFWSGGLFEGLSRSALGAPGRGSRRAEPILIIWSRLSGSSMWTVRSGSAFWDTSRRLNFKIIVISMVTATKITQKNYVIRILSVSEDRSRDNSLLPCNVDWRPSGVHFYWQLWAGESKTVTTLTCLLNFWELNKNRLSPWKPKKQFSVSLMSRHAVSHFLQKKLVLRPISTICA